MEKRNLVKWIIGIIIVVAALFGINKGLYPPTDPGPGTGSGTSIPPATGSGTYFPYTIEIDSI